MGSDSGEPTENCAKDEDRQQSYDVIDQMGKGPSKRIVFVAKTPETALAINQA